MKRTIFSILIVLMVGFFAEARAAHPPKKILLFYKTAAYKHLSITSGIEDITKLGE